MRRTFIYQNLHLYNKDLTYGLIHWQISIDFTKVKAFNGEPGWSTEYLTSTLGRRSQQVAIR